MQPQANDDVRETNEISLSIGKPLHFMCLMTPETYNAVSEGDKKLGIISLAYKELGQK